MKRVGGGERTVQVLCTREKKENVRGVLTLFKFEPARSDVGEGSEKLHIFVIAFTWNEARLRRGAPSI